MRKLLLASYDYRTTGNEYKGLHTLVTVDSYPDTPDHHDVEKAEATFTHWFTKAYPKARLVMLRVTPAVNEFTTLPHAEGDKPEPVIYKKVNGKSYTRDDMSRYADWLWYNDLTPNADETIDEWETEGKPDR